MEFSAFAQILKPLIAEGATAGAFVRTMFENITEFPESMEITPIDETEDNTFKTYYTGSRRLTRFAPKIAKHVEAELFVNYINSAGTDVQNIIYEQLKPYCPNMTESNIPFETAQLFKDIIFSYTKEKPRKFDGKIDAGEESVNQSGQSVGEEASKQSESQIDDDTGGIHMGVQTQIINNPTIVNQQGVNNLHINQVETLIL